MFQLLLLTAEVQNTINSKHGKPEKFYEKMLELLSTEIYVKLTVKLLHRGHFFHCHLWYVVCEKSEHMTINFICLMDFHQDLVINATWSILFLDKVKDHIRYQDQRPSEVVR